jgi:mxaJ protein
MLLLTLSAAVGATPPLITTSGAAGATTRPLRVCADPNNMPFSNARGEGFENGRARLVAGALGAPLEYAWQPQRRGFVRNTLAAGRCDVMMEAPIGYDRADETIPYYRSTYVFVSRRDRRLRVRSFDDPALRRLRIGVEVIGDDYANSPPAELLARRGLAAQVVGFPRLRRLRPARPSGTDRGCRGPGSNRPGCCMGSSADGSGPTETATLESKRDSSQSARSEPGK